MRYKIGSLTIVPVDELKGLNTKRLLTYKKSVLAQKSSIYERVKDTFDIQHPFDLTEEISHDYEEGGYDFSKKITDLIEDHRDYKYLNWYHKRIKEILSTREHVEK